LNFHNRKQNWKLTWWCYFSWQRSNKTYEQD